MKMLKHRNNICMILLFFFFISITCIGQSLTDSTRHNKISILGGVQYHSHIDYGLYNATFNSFPYYYTYWDENKNHLNELLSMPTLSILIGVNRKQTFHTFNFASIEKNAEHATGIGHDILTAKYFNYQAAYNFFNKMRFPVKPMAAFNFSYMNKKYSYQHDAQGGSNWSHTRKFQDNSETYFIQGSINVLYYSRQLFLSFSYNLLIYAWIKGNYQNSETYYIYPQDSFTSIEHYSGNSSSSNYNKQKGTFCVRIAYVFSP